MREPNSANEPSLEHRLQCSPVGRHWWIVDTLAWALFLAVRWLLRQKALSRQP
jgi:hypothetical protein